MILHNDHSLHIGTGPANTRKHVFKISRARQVPLLAGLASKFASARARAATLFRHRERATIPREIPSKFELHRANHRRPTGNVSGGMKGEGRDLTACAGVSERAQRASIPLAPRDIMRTV